MQKKIYLSPPHMSGDVEGLVGEVFRSNWITSLGPMVDGFERDLSAYAGAGHAAALSSGTAAIHLALILLDVRPGDYVVCQTLTFAASVNPVLYLGAEPVFVDSEPETWNMCPDRLEEAISICAKSGKKPKAIIPVHLYGMPARMDRINAVAENHKIPIVEDAAEALGSRLKDRMCGSFGRLGVFSFNGNKIITTSAGGALVSEDEQLISRARFLAAQARDCAPHYEHSEIGYNYRMSNVLAAIGRSQMRVLEDRIRRRRANYDFYKNALKNVRNIVFLPEPNGFFSNRWLTVVLIENGTTGNADRESVRLALDTQNIEARPLWKPMHLQPVFSKYRCAGGAVAERLFEKGLCLPSGSNLEETDLRRVADVVLEHCGK